MVHCCCDPELNGSREAINSSYLVLHHVLQVLYRLSTTGLVVSRVSQQRETNEADQSVWSIRVVYKNHFIHLYSFVYGES